MSSITINFEIKKEPNQRGSFPIRLRLTENKRHFRMNTTVELARLSDWDSKKQRVKTTAPHFSDLNTELERVNKLAWESYRKLLAEGEVSAESLSRQIKKQGDRHYLMDVCNARVEELKDNRQWQTAKKYGDVINKVEAFLEFKGIENCLVNEVDLDFAQDFESYLKTLPNQRYKDGSLLAPNTVVKHMKTFRAILSDCVDKKYLPTNPMEGLELREQTTLTRHLGDDELAKLKNAWFHDGSGLDHVRDMYLFAIYTAGMRLGDVLQLRWNNIINKQGTMRLNYIMSKNEKAVDLILIEEAVAILNKYRTKDSSEGDYIFPYLKNDAPYARYKSYNDIKRMPKDLHEALSKAINAKEALVNKQLKQVADMLSMEKFQFHCSRRDFGRLAYDSGVKSLQIQDLLCHENISTTERYMRKLDTSATDAALEQTFSVESKERKARVLVRELKKLGYGKADVKRLFDDVNK